jgi:putative ABC transport system permease protein
MRNPFGTELWRTIAHSWGRFLAIAGIVALGCGFYAGLRMTGADMRAAGDAFYDGTSLYDVRLVSTLGFSQEQADEVKSVDGVEQVMGDYATDVMATLNDERYAIRVMSLDVGDASASTVDATGTTVASDDPGYLNRLVLAEGSWPTEPGQCVLSADRVMGTPIEVGDTVEVLYGTASLDGVLERRTFTVSGLVHSSAYVSSVALGYTSLGSGVIQQYMYVSPDSFSADLPYTELYVTVRGASEQFSGADGYQSTVDVVSSRLDDQAPALAASRLAEVRRKAQNELDSKRDDYEEQKADAEDQLADAKAQLDDALAKLESSEATIASSEEELAAAREEAYARLADAKDELLSTEEALDDGAGQLADAQSQLDAKRDEAEQAKAGLEAKLADAQRHYDEAKPQIEAGIAQATATKADLGRQRAEAQDQKAQLEALLKTQTEGSAEYQATEAKIDAVAAAIAKLDEGIGAAQATIDDLAKRQADAEGGIAQLEGGISKAEAGLAAIAQGQATLDGKSAELASGREQLEAGWDTYYEQRDEAESQLADAADQIASGKEELASGWDEYDSGKAEYDSNAADVDARLSDAAQQLASAQADIDAIASPDVYVLDRTKSTGVSNYHDDSVRIDNIAAVFPFIFFLVAALVSLTTMTRMVEDERVDIGTHKALGFSTARITAKYLAYAAIASVSGAVLGIAVLSQVLPAVVEKAYAIIYDVPAQAFPLPVDPAISLLAAGLGVGITLGATWLAAAATLREVPATLMLPRAPKAGKRILLERLGPLWRRTSFSWKVTLRNLFRYKRRLAMTVVGIAGCTALLLTGLGLHDAIWDIIDNQFEGANPVFRFNVEVGLDQDATADDVASVEGSLSDLGSADAFTLVDSENMQVSSEGHPGTLAVSVMVPQDVGSFASFVAMRDRVTQQPIDFDSRSVVLTEKVATRLGLAVGDTFTVYDQDDIGNAKGDGYALTLTGITENYVYHYCYVGADAYREATGRDSAPRGILSRIDSDEAVRARLSSALHDVGAVKTVVFNTETIDSYRKSLQSVNMIVVVLVVAAAALAFIVLYNLTNINIVERTREIASLKVLGFTPREVAAYIFREIALLVVLGAAAGLALGVLMEGFVVLSSEVDAVMFGRVIHGGSFAWAFGLTLVFAAFVMLAMLPKLRHIDMVESLKSVD